MTERPQPSPEHVHAVAVVLAQANGTEWDLMPGDDDVYRRDARAILTSDDPAVHAALLAALTRAGVLTEDVQHLAHPWGFDARTCLRTTWRDLAPEETIRLLRERLTAQDGPQEPAHAPEAPVEPHDATGAR